MLGFFEFQITDTTGSDWSCWELNKEFLLIQIIHRMNEKFLKSTWNGEAFAEQREDDELVAECISQRDIYCIFMRR